MHRKSKIFISYAYSERDSKINKFIEDLKREFEVFEWSFQRQQVDDNTSKFLIQKIKESDYVIRVITVNSREWTQPLLQLALGVTYFSSDLKVIQVFFTRFSDEELGFKRGDLRGVTIDFSDDYGKSFQELLNYVAYNSSDSLVTFELGTPHKKDAIISISSKVNEDLIKYLSIYPHKLRVLDRRLFEEIIAEIFCGFGFDVELTKLTRDGGRDIVAIKNAETKLKYLVECKRPEPGNLIGVKPVRELFGIKQDEKASKAILATTSYFSKEAMQLFERNIWELEPRDYDGIMRWIADYKKLKHIA